MTDMAMQVGSECNEPWLGPQIDNWQENSTWDCWKFVLQSDWQLVPTSSYKKTLGSKCWGWGRGRNTLFWGHPTLCWRRVPEVKFLCVCAEPLTNSLLRRSITLPCSWPCCLTGLVIEVGFISCVFVYLCKSFFWDSLFIAYCN